jgi:hypothetical protein
MVAKSKNREERITEQESRGKALGRFAFAFGGRAGCFINFSFSFLVS